MLGTDFKYIMKRNGAQGRILSATYTRNKWSAAQRPRGF